MEMAGAGAGYARLGAHWSNAIIAMIRISRLGRRPKHIDLPSGRGPHGLIIGWGHAYERALGNRGNSGLVHRIDRHRDDHRGRDQMGIWRMTQIGNAKLDDGRAICIEYEIESHGCATNNWDEPGEAPILELGACWIDDDIGEIVQLTPAEHDRIMQELIDAFEADDGADWDDWYG